MGGSANMTARLASVDDQILARAEYPGTLRESKLIPPCVVDDSMIVGMHFDCGYLSPYFITDPERMEVIFENSYVLIHEGTLSVKQDLLPILEQIAKSGKPLLIIAESVGDDVLAALVVNKLRGPLQVAAVRAPGCGDQRKSVMQEMALLAGARIIAGSLDISLNKMQISELGWANKVTVDKNNTAIEFWTSSSHNCVSECPVQVRNARMTHEHSLNIRDDATATQS
jgi:chaperonin GroEL (HSP60 family)